MEGIIVRTVSNSAPEIFKYTICFLVSLMINDNKEVSEYAFLGNIIVKAINYRNKNERAMNYIFDYIIKSIEYKIGSFKIRF